MSSDILIFGTGSLASALCCSLAITQIREPLIVKILGRTILKSQNLATIANVRANIQKTKFRFVADTINWDSRADLLTKIKSSKPKIILHASSLQSPWDFSQDTKWTDLIKSAGFGLTLPLQALLAVKVASAIQEINENIVLINACYPDAVNVILKMLGFEVACGIGNISILESTLNTTLKKNINDQLRIIGHHYHVGSSSLSVNVHSNNNPRVWLNNKEISIETINQTLAPIRKINDSILNQITGLAAVKIILAFFCDRSEILHVPGPNGLPGGYPVIVENKRIRLTLPSDISEEEVLTLNYGYSEYDGVKFNRDGVIQFNDKAKELLGANGFDHLYSFKCETLNEICHEMLKLRKKLVGDKL